MNKTQKITLSLFLLYMISAIQSSIMSVVQNDIINAYGLTGAQIGLLSTASSIGMFASLFTIPIVQSKVKRVVLMTFGAALMVLNMCLIGFSSSWLILLMAICFMGIGGNYMDTFLNSLVIDLNGEKSFRYVNLLHTFFSVGALVNPYIVRAIALWGGWRSCYYIIAIFVVIFFINFRIQARKGMDVPAMRQSKGAELTKAVIIEMLHDKRIVLTALQSTLYSSAKMGIANYMVTFIKREVPLPQSTGFSLLDTLTSEVLPLSLLWAGITIGRLLMAKLRLNPVKALAYGCFISVPIITVGLLATNFWGLCIMTFAFGVICGHGIPSLTARAGQNTPGRTALGTTISSLIGHIISILWPLLITTIAGKAGFKIGLLVTPFLLIASGIIGLFNNKACEQYDLIHQNDGINLLQP